MADLEEVSPGRRLRVVVAEDDLLTREGVCRLLESSGQVEVVAAVGDAETLHAAVAEHRPSVVLTDIRMPPGYHTEGIAAAKQIRREYAGTGVVVLSQHADAVYVVDLLGEGAEGLGYLLKERVADRTQLVHALRETSRGGSVVDPVLLTGEPSVRGGPYRLVCTDSPLPRIDPRRIGMVTHPGRWTRTWGAPPNPVLAGCQRTVKQHLGFEPPHERLAGPSSRDEASPRREYPGSHAVAADPTGSGPRVTLTPSAHAS